MEYIKVNDNEIKVAVTKVEEHIYPYEWLIEQRAVIQKAKDEAIIEYDNKIAELDVLIAKCKELGVAEKPVEPIEPIIVIEDTGEIIR